MEHKSGEEVFWEAYNGLNSKQREAVDTIEGPVMVIAGPGTGKTQILTLRIANILLKTDTRPENILALTFTDAGVAAMRERLHRYVGTLSYQVPIHTFHGFAGVLIRDYPEYYERIIGGRLATDLERIAIVEDILLDSNVKKLRPAGKVDFYVKSILSAVEDLKKENISPGDFASLLLKQEQGLESIERYHEKGPHKGKERGDYKNAAKSLEKNRELLYVYQRYDAVFRDQGLYDFGDMIIETVNALEQYEDLRQSVQEQYQYLLADEHQDVNGAQNRILELLADYHDNPNIFVVGDEKQAIYRFQGASLDNFLFFEGRFKNTKVIALEDNYRSGPEILTTAYELMVSENEVLRDLRIPLKAAKEKKSQVLLKKFKRPVFEDDWILSLVKERLASGIDPKEIAIIARGNAEVVALSAYLRKHGVAVTASAETDILLHPVTVSFEFLLQAAVNPTDKTLLPIVQSAYLGLSFADVMAVLTARTYVITLPKLIADRELLLEAGVSEPEKLLHLNEVLLKARELGESNSPLTVLEYLLRETGFLETALRSDPIGNGKVIRRLYDEVELMILNKTVITLGDVVQQFARLKEYNLSLSSAYLPQDVDGVSVTTAHKSKGLEYEVVIVVRAADSVWSNARSRGEQFKLPLYSKAAAEAADVLDDDARLFYVALTRAKKELYLTFSLENTAGKQQQPTRLLDRVMDFLVVEDVEVETGEVDALSVIKNPEPLNLPDTEFIKKVILQRGFSATSFNNYRKNPWDYFYRNVLRIPEVKNLSSMFGTAVHGVLEQVVNYYNAEKSFPNDTLLKRWLEKQLDKLPLSVVDYTNLLARGLESLYPYVQHMQQNLPEEMRPEMELRTVLETGLTELPELPLTGKIDRFDMAMGEALRVYDYKTGNPKTLNEILGNTQSSDGGYKMQLVFYALLLEQYGDERFLTKNGVLSFVESGNNGVIKEVELTTTREEIDELKEQLIATVKELLRGEFLLNEELATESVYAHLAVELCRKLKGVN